MRRTGKLVVGLIGMFGAALFTGCASQDSVDNARTENRTLIERNQELQSRLTRAESEASQERQLREGREKAYADLEGRYNTLRSSLGGTEAEMARLEDMIRAQGLIDPATDEVLGILGGDGIAQRNGFDEVLVLVAEEARIGEAFVEGLAVKRALRGPHALPCGQKLRHIGEDDDAPGGTE